MLSFALKQARGGRPARLINFTSAGKILCVGVIPVRFGQIPTRMQYPRLQPAFPRNFARDLENSNPRQTKFRPSVFIACLFMTETGERALDFCERQRKWPDVCASDGDAEHVRSIFAFFALDLNDSAKLGGAGGNVGGDFWLFGQLRRHAASAF